MSIDTQALRFHVSILDLAGNDTPLRKVASTRGGEFAGSCPFCGGHDRFRVQPDQGLWWCRQCSEGERWQDVIAYVMKRDSVSFVDACAALGATDDGPRILPRRAAAPAPLPADLEPAAEWRTSAQVVVEACETALWSAAGAKIRDYLHARGLTDETLRRWRVGYNAADRSIAGLWVQRGITLPWSAQGQLWQLRVRRPEGSVPKYVSVAGGHPLLFMADALVGRAVAVLVEGEFDAMLLHQEAGDLVGVATLGGADKQLGMGAVRLLLPISLLLLAYDMDSAGRRGSERIAAVSARMRRVTVPSGKDVTEFWQQGGRVRSWIQYEMARLGPLPAAPSGVAAPVKPDAAYTAAGERVSEILAAMTAAYKRGDETDRQRIAREEFNPAAEAYRAAGLAWATAQAIGGGEFNGRE